MRTEPWFVPSATRWLEEQARPGWRAFEWGSGGSTLWLERLCRYVVSVEHNPSWWELVSDAARSASTLAVLVLPGEADLGDDPGDPLHYRSSCVGGDFRQYAQFIEEFDEPFDLVLVDGRARASCLAHAAPKVAAGGVLVLDNAEREWYLRDTAALFEGWERRDFREGDWVTATWTK